MNKEYSIKSKLTPKQIFTIPNILSFVRILLIPIIIYLYCAKSNYLWALIILAISGLTDVIDGFIARKFNMITDFGKFIDPLADKSTQIAVLICLVSRFKLMLLPLVILLVKEVFALILRYVAFKKTGEIKSAEWHGKVSTILLYVLMGIHIMWFNVNMTLSIILILLVSAVMIFSCSLYSLSTIKQILTKSIKNN